MRRACVIIWLMLSVVSCGDTYKSSIPDTRVNFEVNLLNPYSILTTPGHFVLITKINKIGEAIGYGGLIVGNSYFHGYCAFDRCCPIEAKRDVILTLREDGDGTKAVCRTCGSEFDLNNNGVLVKGEGGAYLKSYKVEKVGDNVLTVYN